MMIGALGRLVPFSGRRHFRRDQRNAGRADRGRATGGWEAGLQKRSSLAGERFLEISVVQFKFRASLVVTCAHHTSLAVVYSPGLNRLPPVRADQQRSPRACLLKLSALSAL